MAELIAFFAMATVLRWPMESIGFLFSFTLDARTATDRIFEVFDEENTIIDPADADRRSTGPAASSRSRTCTSDIRMPRTGERDLLDGIDLVLRPGETMALVGLTGSGKTTLTTLPSRLYDVTGGRVTLDGVDVRDLTLHELRMHVGMAFEDATLFSQTVRDNVLLGREDLEPGSPEAEAVMREALEVAQASFVDDLPERRRHDHRRGGPLASRAVSVSASRSRAPSPRGRRCSCSMTRCRRSTSTPRRSWKMRCAKCCTPPPRWSSRTGRRP